MEYCGIDLHAEQSQICILDEDGEVMETSRVRTSRKALERFFSRDRMRVVMEAGWSPRTHLHICWVASDAGQESTNVNVAPIWHPSSGGTNEPGIWRRC